MTPNDRDRRRLDDVTLDQFTADRDETDLTAYRLSAIGEATSKLSDAIKARHPDIPWAAIYGMRNVIAHDYGSVIPGKVWNVVIDHLEPLRQCCDRELHRPDH